MVISVSGISGSGKTTLTKALLAQLPGAQVLHFDDIPGQLLPMDYCEWSESGADYSLWDLSMLEQMLRDRLAQQPSYVFVDYPFGRAHPVIAPYINFALWIDTPLDVALARRLLRDKKPHDLEFYLARHRQTYLVHEATVRLGCDFVLDGTLPLETLTKTVLQHI